jgi:hypothetical protein
MKALGFPPLAGHSSSTAREDRLPEVGFTSPVPLVTFRTPIRHPVNRVSDTLSAE